MITAKELAVLAFMRLIGSGSHEAATKVALAAIANPGLLLGSTATDAEIIEALTYCAGMPIDRYLITHPQLPCRFITFSQVVELTPEQHEKNRKEFNLLNRVRWIS